MGVVAASAGSPWTGLSVRTVVTNPSTRPGLWLAGEVRVTAGRLAAPVDHVAVGLVTQVEPADPDADRLLVEFNRVRICPAFAVPAGGARRVPLRVPVPWETPVTVLGGRLLLSLRMGLRTEVAAGPLVDQGDMSAVYVHPLPAQERLLDALESLGCELRQAGLMHGRLPGVRQALPFHQKIGYWLGPLYRGPASEIEVTFRAEPRGLEVIVGLDRRLALAGVGHHSLSRFWIGHDRVDETDWVRLTDQWIRRAVNRHAETAGGGARGADLRPPTHPHHAPDHVTAPNQPPQATAGGGGGAGGGDGT